MTTEIAENQLTFEVTVNTEITMHNEAKLNELVSSIENKYDNLVFTEDMLGEAKKSRAELNKYSEAINRAKIEAKNNYNAPLVEFEEKIKGYIARINEVSEPIAEKVREFEESQRLERLKQVKELIAEIIESSDVSVEAVVIQKEWLTKNVSEKKRRQLIIDEVARLQEGINHKINEVAVVKDYCAALNVDDGGWLIQIEQGVPSGKVIASIKNYVKEEKERLDEQKRQDELKAVQEQEVAERKAEVQRQLEADREARITQAKEKMEKVVPEPVSKPTAENVIPPEPKQQAVAEETEILILKLTVTTEQKRGLGRYITSAGIGVEQL